ncbi:MAG TPA: SpoIIE family protein phosphatase [Terracidiphilus sp.]|nr:SpoIIE family protein phosphatase [Terracidiphilus sp.]
MFLLLLLWCSASTLIAQAATASTSNDRGGDTAVPVTLGQSVVALNGPWKFRIGDNPKWADPSYDDSQWETVDLTPTPQTTVPGVPIPGFVAGWEARGHPGYAGYAWYRMRVRIRGAASPLTLLSPEWFDDAFQVFANGRLIGSFGDFNGSVPTLYEGKPARFSLPVSAYESSPGGTTFLAFRFYMATASLGLGVRGGMHGPPRIGLPGAATAVFHMEWEREYRRMVSAFAAGLLYFLFALLIAMIFAFSRSDKILLWPLSASVLAFIQVALILSTNARWASEVRLEGLIGFTSLTAGYLWLLTWWAYFGFQRTRWLFKTILALGVWNLATLEFFTILLRIGRSSRGLLIAEQISELSNGTAVFLVMATIAYLGWKRAERRQWPLFLALFFQSFQVFEPELNLLHMRTSWQPFGVLLPLHLISNCASLFFFSIVLFGQFRSSQQRQQAMEDDVKQAKQIQQFLIPEQQPAISGFRIETEYRPAREVGGDFFQIVPNKADGSLLIVAGDVTGKGLQAGMLVAMLVGAIRTESAHTSDPTRILCALNTRLQGREHAQATCLALLIAKDGAATLANAGHIAPYLNGEPLPMEGALPLGMIEAAEPSVMHFQLKHDDKLILMSDGIAEAMDADGKLFGFDRIHNMLRSTQTAAAIATAAQQFGQEDDISIISVTRTRMLEPVTA